MITTRQVGSLHLRVVEASGTGAPVLCLHGLFAGAWVFDEVLPLIAARGHPAYALSFRDHPPAVAGPELGRHGIEAFVEDAATVARELGRPIVIGHSLGGLVAQVLLARDLVRAAILLSPAPPRGIPVFSLPLLRRMTRYLPALLRSRPFKPTDADLDALVLNRVPEAERPAIRDALVADSGRAARQAALGVVGVPRRAVRAPILVVSGDDDRFVPVGVARKVAARYAAPLYVAGSHGHFLTAEPGWRAHVGRMLDWIDDLPPAARDAANFPAGA